jgi:hypothetical protein
MFEPSDPYIFVFLFLFYFFEIPEIFPYKTPDLEYINFATPCIFEIKIRRRFQFLFTDFSLVCRSAFVQIFPRSQPMRESNTSN